MAVTITDSPYQLTPRGQKLMFIAESTNVANDGFKYVVNVTESSSGKVFTFLLAPYNDDRCYYDLSSVANLFNDEIGIDHTAYSQQNETLGKGINEYVVDISEGWLVAGVFTNQGGNAAETIKCINAYYQATDGYKPNVANSSPPLGFALSSTLARAWSDRTSTTHINRNNIPVSLPSGIQVPAYDSDYGLFCGARTGLISSTAERIKIQMFNASGVTLSSTTIFLSSSDMLHVGIYPMNLQDGAPAVKPSLNPTWAYYEVYFMDGSNVRVSQKYIYYRASLYGQLDCRYTPVRLAWVGSRGGWEYQNFIKKTTKTFNIDRKRYRQVLWNGTTSIYTPSSRGLTEFTNVTKLMYKLTSDWISQGEFEYLKGLLVSKQVMMFVGTDLVPVVVEDSSYVQQTTEDGKLYNLELNIQLSNDYWN